MDAFPQTSLLDLPPTTHDFLLGCLPPQDLVTFAKVSKKSRELVQDFYRRAYRVQHLLSPYFDADDIVRFCILQHAIGFVISGSSALTFIARETPYPDSDLDVYVDQRWCAVLLHFLESHGYAYQPIVTDTKHQPSDVYQAFEVALSRRAQGDWNGHPGFLGGGQEYFFTQITDVFNFFRDGKKIQIIACSSTPLEVILDFHSTVVMSFVCYSHAVCLFPRSTFVDNFSVVNYHRNVDQKAAREKYRQRGWEMVDEVDALRGLSDRSDTNYFDYRHVADRLCWTIPLNTVCDFVQSDLTNGLLDNYTLNSWRYDYFSNKMNFERLTVRDSQESYCLPRNVWRKVLEEGLPEDINTDRGSVASAFRDLVNKHLRPNRSPDEPREVCRRIVVGAFEEARRRFPLLPMDKLPPLRAGSLTWSCARTLLENLKTPPEISISFKQDKLELFGRISA
ncbi:hypothetical protein VNI00_009852 [Paramarasmius palmivorus]|uniref:F-box domain-containing protein n=1 Tax=Paramarasmius palmivorus TaxID=297713 RepID=A0AAW0CNX9_9AGAR